MQRDSVEGSNFKVMVAGKVVLLFFAKIISSYDYYAVIVSIASIIVVI